MEQDAGAQSPFATPDWLERSFVLPLTPPSQVSRPVHGSEVIAVPHQHVPRHDDLSGQQVEAASSAQPFVRPPSTEIDFARVIKRAEVTRVATRTATVSGGFTGLALIAYLISSSALVLPVLAFTGLVTLVALAVRLRVSAAPIPHLER